MPEDRSLDDFSPRDGDETETAESDAPADGDETETAESDAPVDGDADDVDPAVATSTWHADGAACDRCGKRVQRRWRDGEGLVCSDCASW